MTFAADQLVPTACRNAKLSFWLPLLSIKDCVHLQDDESVTAQKPDWPVSELHGDFTMSTCMSHLLPIYLLIYRSFRIQARPGPRLVCVWGWGLGSCLCVKSFTPRSFYLNYNPWFYLYRHLGIHPYTIKTYTKNNQNTVDYTQDLGGVNWGKVTALPVQDGEMTVKVIHKNSITAGNNIDKGPKWAEESKRLPHNSLHSFTGDETKEKSK